jgi:transcriptional regulator with XRE-family HTH domain
MSRSTVSEAKPRSDAKGRNDTKPFPAAKQSSESKHAVFGDLLRFWREVRGFSQESLAFEADSSARHISRIENGKAMPSFAMIENLASVMKLGNRDAAYLFLAAGHVPPAESIEFDDVKYRWLRKAMTRTLKALDPNPTVLMDRFGNILMANKAWAAFSVDGLQEKGGMANITNYHDFLFTCQSFEDAQDLRINSLSLILMAIKQESVLTGDPQFEALLERLMAYPEVPAGWEERAANLEPMSSYRVQFEQGTELVRYYNVSQSVSAMGPVSFVAEPRLIITTLFAEDESREASLPDQIPEHPLLYY